MKPPYSSILFKHLAIFIFIFSLCSPCYGDHSVKVIRVVDGDTLKIDFHGIELMTRLIGVDTPESRRNKKAKRDAKRSDQDLDTIVALGKKATEYVKRLVRPGNFVRLEFDVQQTDPYGRLLCYVYLQDGRMLNELLISSGHATIMTMPPNVKYQSRFLKAYKRQQLKKYVLLSGPHKILLDISFFLSYIHPMEHVICTIYKSRGTVRLTLPARIIKAMHWEGETTFAVVQTENHYVRLYPVAAIPKIIDPEKKHDQQLQTSET